MKKEDFERLKAVCEKEGFEIESGGKILDRTLICVKPKDIWDGVEFAEFIGFDDSEDFTKNKIYKVNGVLGNRLNICNDNSGCKNGWQKIYFKPSTERAYIEQLKKDAFERFGEIKYGDLFDRSSLLDFKDTKSIGDCYGFEGFRYYKENDGLDFNGTCIYKQGKWATRVKERVKVYPKDILTMSSPFGFGTEFKFALANRYIKDLDQFKEFLASQLEKYLNGEIE